MLSKQVLASDAWISMDDTCLRSMRQSVYRRHDLTTGFNMERGNLGKLVACRLQTGTGAERLVVVMKHL